MLVHIFGYIGRNSAKYAFRRWSNANKQLSRYAAWSYDRVLQEHDIAIYDIEGEIDETLQSNRNE